MPKCRHEFLQREHSEGYGELDESNWRDLTLNRNWNFVDPTIQDLVRLLNDKGFTTFSSCSGGHKSDMRKGSDRHVPGFVTFSPPSRVVFKLYVTLQRKSRRFQFKAFAGLNNEDDRPRQTVYSKLEWQLEGRYCSKRRYYSGLFADMTGIVEGLKPGSRGDSLLRDILKEDFPHGRRILDLQQTRFR